LPSGPITFAGSFPLPYSNLALICRARRPIEKEFATECQKIFLHFLS